MNTNYVRIYESAFHAFAHRFGIFVKIRNYKFTTYIYKDEYQ
jgi:hypothetical protein